MASTVTIDLRHVARGLDFPLRQVQAVVELLDEGNTVPFITRYRKDQTGGLDEEQIREIQDRLSKMRLLAERKQTVLRSIDAQGKLTEKLAKQIFGATTVKRLEDLYLPFKPKKQTLATLARSRGLEELATEILEAAPSALDLDARARDFANPDRQIPSAADALLGAGHILAEQFSERADLRQRLREILQKSGKIVTTQIVSDSPAATAEASPAEAPTDVQVEEKVEDLAEIARAPGAEASDAAEQSTTEHTATEQPLSPPEPTAEKLGPTIEPADSVSADSVRTESERPAASSSSAEVVAENDSIQAKAEEAVAHSPDDAAVVPPSTDASGELASASINEPAANASTAASTTGPSPSPLASAARRVRDRERAKAQKQAKKEAKKRKLDERRTKAFRDYFNYAEDIKKIPPHRVLAINRAERAKVLRVKIDCDLEAMAAALEETLVPPDHPHADFLRGAARDALNRLILPALEREARRELSDRAESHAVNVFARNLRNLLLQPPVHNRRVLAVDPGFKSGCKLAALDQFGNLLGHDVIMLVGSKPERKEEAKQKAIAFIRQHELTVVAIGNGTACRETEEFFAELLSGDFKEQGVAYVIVNEAGASVYSTSQLGREELPEYDATLRGAVSIGRRLLDPLSELVKIEPANIGVGLYQHDVKSKHLEASLDEVVESCVNYVGVDVNTASPALLRYVSGLNQLTARRVYEYRREHGPFRSREQLREVAGFGDATFVQSAGFLKIAGGENPLDATWIHPESYPVADKVMEHFQCKAADLADKEAAAALAERMAAVKLDELAKQVAESLAKEVAEKSARREPEYPLFPDEAPAASEARESASEVPAVAEAAPVAEVDQAEAQADAPEAIAATDAPADAPAAPREPSIGTLTLRDILAQLARPGRDPREDLPPPVFKQGIIKLEDLAAGMELTGTVLNVVDFGCFVDIGMHDSGLVHVSRLADRFIRDPHEAVAVGDIVHVWVMEVDKERRRVSLTMVRPGSERPRRPPRGEGGAEQGAEGRDHAPGRHGDRPPRSGQDCRGGRPQGQQGGQQAQQQGDRPPQAGQPQSGRPQGGRPDQGRRPPPAGSQTRPGGQGHSDRRDRRGPPSRGSRYEDTGTSRAREFKPKPGPVAPITDAMKKGKEPMRTFGDLMQFFGATDEKKKPPEKESKKGGKKPEPVASDLPAEATSAEPASPPHKPEAQVTGIETAVPHEPDAHAGAASQPDASARDASQGKAQTSAAENSGEPPAPAE